MQWLKFKCELTKIQLKKNNRTNKFLKFVCNVNFMTKKTENKKIGCYY